MRLLALYRSYKYELIAFLTGGSVMVLEIVGARLIAPNFGASTYVWTAMIGVILTALAVGFAVGGRLADRYNDASVLSLLLIMAAILVLAMGMFQEGILEDIARFGLDLRLGALLAAAVLFALPSFLIGMVSPHLAKIRVTSLETTGRSIGKLEAAGAFGSIAGTFACGYFLLGMFGSRSIVIGIVFVLLLASLMVDPLSLKKVRRISLAVLILMAFAISSNPSNVLADVDSSYARYQVVERQFGNLETRMLLTDNGGVQSAVPADGSDMLVLSYVRAFAAAAEAYGSPRQALVIGGGTYTFPSWLIRTYPETHVDVAEIDPALDRLAREHFYFKPSERLKIHHADGRMFLNQTSRQYGLVYMDAFSSLSPPFQLTTTEAVSHIRKVTAPDGVAVVNLIGRYSLSDSSGEYVNALRTTYLRHFKYVSVHQVVTGVPLDGSRQNLMLVASGSAEKFRRAAAAMPGPALHFPSSGKVLTDDFAPVERLTY